MKLYGLTLNGTESPMLAPVAGVRFGWKIDSDIKNTQQVCYRLKIFCGDEPVFDSGTVVSGISADIAPEGLNLRNETEYTLKVEAETNHGETAEGTMNFSTELAPDGWDGAKWIRPAVHIPGWAPYMRTKFILEEKQITSAVLYCCGLGCSEFYINGKRTDDNYIDPPSTNYEASILYRAFEVKDLLKNGGNALAVLLGEGFYSQSRVWGQRGMVFGPVCAIAKLRITFADGTVQTVITDPTTWSGKYSPITVNNIYGGEIYDCRLETPDFAEYEGSENGWEKVVADETPKGRLVGCLMPPVKIIREIPAVSVKCASGKNDGAWIFDMGENFAGIYEVSLPPSPRGAVYVFRTAETVNAGGDLDFRSSGAFATQCIQQEIYIARGDECGEVYRPRFTYHGFRYVEITGIHDFSQGYGTMPKAKMIKGLALATALRPIGSFDSSNEDLNNLARVMHNTFLSNYHGHPEDCPAREKCGWLGDAEIVANWALFNYDMTAAYEKYLQDIRETTEVYGSWQMISPGKRGCGEASPLWGCAQIIIPYWMWRYTGNRSIILNNIDMMRKWVDHEVARAKDFVISEGLGDWCPPGGNDGKRRIPVEQSSTFMFYEICDKMAELSRAFGFGDEEKYRNLADDIRGALITNFYDRKKHSFGYWASNGAALILGVYPKGDRQALLEATVAEIRRDDYAMCTGIYGNKYLVPALIEAGFGDDALKFLFNRSATSFGTMLDQGATSMWESTEMHMVECDAGKDVASYNHPMQGGFMYSYYTCLAGIEPLEPGFRRFRIKPCHAQSISRIKMQFDSPYGQIGVAYCAKSDGSGYSYTLTVPANTQAVFESASLAEPIILGSGTWYFDA